MIGGPSDNTSHEFFVGAIDEVRIYDRALNDEEINQLYYTECTLSVLIGPTEICQGQQDVTYFVDPLFNASVYEWYYSGTGVTIHGNGNQITIDYATDATSGTLSVIVKGDLIDTQTRSIAIQVNILPLDAGIINGEAEVCQGETGVPYNVTGIENAKTYHWNYNGTGASINGNTNKISIDFAADATGGILTVAGNNACGDGSASPPLAIAIRQLPYNPETIAGESTVCQGQQGVPYSIPAIQNASGYTWNYSGTGVTINGDSSHITLHFDPAATSGDLTVSGTNNCGNSASPSVFPITVLSIPGNAGIIAGEHAVCLNQIEVLYSVPVIESATSYLWEYSGTGAALTGNTNTIGIDFSDQATSGNLTVTGHNTCSDGIRSPEFSITVSDCSLDPVEIIIPNSFTPNGDGVNDVFFIQGLPENSTLIIFDRAGHTLFESFSYANDWDGKDKGGKALISGTYWYVLSVLGQPEDYKGFVYVKR
jgi:gliding motility-associated-like protein